MPVFGLPLLRAVLLSAALGFIVFVVNSGTWVDTQLAHRDQQTVLEESLTVFINEQIADKNIPGLSITIIRDQETVFEMGFGHSDKKEKIPSTPYTVYRGGTIAQLFTTIAILQRVELGHLDLDAPVSSYLPQFSPQNPYGLPLTLRQILSHQSGLSSEPPVGHSFDTSSPSLRQTVISLNETEIVYPPETFTKFSNSGYGVAGFILESTLEKPFEQYMRAILDRMDMMRTSYSPRLDLVGKLAQGYSTSFEGRLRPTTGYEAGNIPATNLYTTANDMGTFLKVFFAEGHSVNGRILDPKSLEQMWTIQLSTARRRRPYGLGFAVTQMSGEVRASLGSSFQGHSTHIDLLPESKLGVAVLANHGNAEIILEKIAHYALELLKADANQLSLPKVPRTYAVDNAMITQAIGYYQDASSLYISALDSDLFLYKDGTKYRLRQIGDSLIVDDTHAYGPILLSDGLNIELDNTLYVEKDPLLSLRPHGQYDPLLGVYGHESSPIILVEHEQKLYALEDWRHSYPLTEVSRDTFLLPADGMYGGEKVIFTRDEQNMVHQIYFANMVLNRLPETAYAYYYDHIPLDESYRTLSQQALPPPIDTLKQQTVLLDLTMVDPLLNLDIGYASTDNIFDTQLYNEARVLLQQPIGEAFFRIQKKLRSMGYGLKIYDAYRPWRITQSVWQSLPEELRVFYDDPAGLACQSRGAGISVAVYRLNSGEELSMPGEYDILSTSSHVDFPILPSEQRHNRSFLRFVMESEGFRASTFNWWAFNHESCPSYSLIDILHEDVNQSDVLQKENIYTVR